LLEANEQYWRKKPSIKRVVIKGVPRPHDTLGHAQDGRGGYRLPDGRPRSGPRYTADPKLRLAKVIAPATWWMEYPEQWNPKSPWSDRRVRLAAALAVDKQGLNEAEAARVLGA